MHSISSSLKNGALVSSAGVFGSALLWLLSFKAVALWMGPEGIGLFSQLRQMAQAATLGATFGGTNSVVQGIAERRDELERRQFRAAVVRLVGATGLGVVLVMVVAAPQLAEFFLSANTPDLVAAVRWIALAVLLNVGGIYVLAVLNGYRSYSFLALAQIAGPAALLLLLAAAWWWPLPKNPVLLAGSFVLCFGVTWLAGALGVSRLPKLAAAMQPQTLANEQLRAFMKFALSNLIAALSTAVTLLLIRSWAIESKGLAFAGLFDAGWTLTFNYITIFLTACSAIYLPLLAGETRAEEQKSCILKAAYLVLGISIPICLAMVVLKEPLINLLYSPQFQASGEVLVVLVIAVIFRSASWVYGTVIVATRDSRVLMVSDLALNLSLLATTRYALDSFGTLEALSWAFVLPNFLYLIFVVEYAGMKNSLMRRGQIWPLVLGGTVPLLYLALMSGGSQWAYAELAKWLCMTAGLAVSIAALFAYKKVVP
jgi:PST family polysaccharide transporter